MEIRGILQGEWAWRWLPWLNSTRTCSVGVPSVDIINIICAMSLSSRNTERCRATRASGVASLLEFPSMYPGAYPCQHVEVDGSTGPHVCCHRDVLVAKQDIQREVVSGTVANNGDKPQPGVLKPCQQQLLRRQHANVGRRDAPVR